MAAKKKSSSTTNSVKNQSQSVDGVDSAFAPNKALKEQEVLHERNRKKLDAQLSVQESINEALKEAKDLTEDQSAAAKTLTKMWGDFESIASKYHQDVKDGIMTQEQANKKLKQMRVGFDRMLKASGLNTKENADLLKIFQKMSSEMQSVEKAYDKTAKKAGLLNTALDQVGSSGIPLMRELGDVLKNIVERNATGAKLAITALGAAAAGIAMNYFGAEPKAAIQAENDRKQLVIDGNADIAKIENKRGFIIAKKELERSKNRIETENTVNTLKNEADFASQRAAIQFSSTMQNAAAEFRAASKTAFFGKGLGSVSYSAGQLQLAGISAEQIAGSMSAASNAMGKNISSELAANMSVMEKRTGQSAENLASITEYFMRTDKVGAESAINMQEGFRAMADSANVNLGGAMEEVAQATKEALGYQIKSGPALQKQVIYAKSLGVSFNDIAKAGKSMVLNYKDSIKNEIQLSAMLGRNVNLSEARNLFAQGKTDEALKSIQAQGLDPAKMNIFQQEALSQALGGLDLNSIQKIAQNQGRTGGELKGANANKANKGYLAANTAAQSSLASEQANISANTAVIDAKLSGQITDAYLNSKEYKAYQASLITLEKQQTVINQKENLLFSTSVARIEQLAKTAQLGIERSVTENGLNLVAGVVGGVISNVVGGKIVDKIAGKAAGKIAEKTVSKATTKATTKASEKAAGKIAEKTVSKATTKATTKASEKAAEKLLAKESGKVFAKAGAKTLGKSLLKKIPFLGLGAALFFAADRAMAGDYTGAGMEIASGGASMLPGIGTGASIGIDAAIAARDMGAFDSKNPTATVKKPGTVSAKSASVVGKPSLVLSDVQYQTRLQMKMVELLGTNAILLQSILEETDKDKSIKLNGVKLNSQLMLNARKQMAVSRKEAVGTNASM